MQNKLINIGILVKILFFVILFSISAKSQYNLNYFLQKAYKNSAALKEYNNNILINRIQKDLDYSQNGGFQISLTGNYLFAPYFNNNGKIISTDPQPDAIGYDVGLSNGGLYSTQVNVSKNMFNSPLLNLLDEQNATQNNNFQYNIEFEKHNLEKQVTEQYFNALLYLLQTDLSNEISANLNEQLNISEKLMKNGFIKEQDYLLLKIEMKNQIINAEETYQQYKSNLYQLFALCGIRDTQIIKIDTINLTMINPPQTSAFLNKYYYDSISNETRQKIFEAKYNPQVEVFLNAGLNAVEIENMQKKLGFSAGINFSLPIFDGNQKNLTRQQQLIGQKINSENREYFETYINIQKAAAKVKIISLKNNLKILREQIDDYNTIIENSARQLKLGNISMIDYLVLVKNFIEIRKNYISTTINYKIEINNHNYWNW